MLLSYTPCPNDTFVFHALANKLSKQYALDFDIKLADVQTLNESLIRSEPDVCKVSFFAFGKARDNYVLLPVGAALGHGNGQKIIAPSAALSVKQLSTGRIVIPGQLTTAYLLYRILLPRAQEESFCFYDQVIDTIVKGQADYGIILHETRFTFAEHGMVEVADLGQIWEQTYQLPLPLGCFVAKKSLGSHKIKAITKAIQESISYAQQNPEASKKYVTDLSIEKNWDVIERHIKLFVNDESAALSPKGLKAINLLLDLGYQKGLLPAQEVI